MSRRGGNGAGQLSMLARGHGLLGGGVQVECFADDRRAFTLMGQPILKPSSPSPSTLKPYRSHQLALPATYVTRRGQMVLFTAPEDMIIGSSCHIHERDMTSEVAAKKLKTTNNLLNSALNYSIADKKFQISSDSPVHDNEDVSMATAGVKAGHFTNVYLNSLQKSTQKSTNQIADDCAIEDIEISAESSLRKESAATDVLVPGDSEVPLVSECDSGLGQSIGPSPSSGRISMQSHISSDASSVSFMPSGHVIRVPDGRDNSFMASEKPNGTSLTTPTATRPSVAVGDGDPLSSLRKELGLQQFQVSQSNSSKKSSSKSGKKRHHPKTGSCHATNSPSKVGERKNKKHSSIRDGESAGKGGSKTAKSRRKRTRNKLSNQNGNRDSNMEILKEEEAREPADVDESSERLKVTAVQLALSEGGGSEGDSLQRMSLAEERRREIERKRVEKRELERKKKEEEERRLKLQEDIGDPSKHTTDLPLPSTDDRQILAAHDVVTLGQKSLRSDLEEMKLKNARLLLSYQGERLEDKLSEDMDSAQAAIELARAVKEREEERRSRLAGEEKEGGLTEECKKCGGEGTLLRGQHLPEKTTVFRGRHGATNSDLPVERRLETFTGKYMFSYFRYVAPQPPKVDNKKGKRSRRPKGIRTK